MRSDMVDQLFSTYLKQPVRFNWDGGPTDLLRGTFAEASIELGGIATAWLPLESVVLSATHVAFEPGLPGQIRVEAPRFTAIIAQRDVDKWLRGTQLPFELELTDAGLVARAKVAGLNVGEIAASLEVLGGWFVLRPSRASLLGVPNYAAWLFRTYLPLPPVADGARLEEIGHQDGGLRLSFAIDDFDEDLTPGLAGRLRGRILP
jgi:hypothetical protein